MRHFSSLLKLSRVFTAFALLSLFTAPVQAADDTYTTLLNTANQFRQDGKLPEALQTATTATLLAPDRYEAYFLAGVIAHQQGADADAKPLIEKSLALAPADAKPKIQKFLDTLGSTNTAPAPATSAPPGPPPLDATTKRKLDALLLIPGEADAATDPDQRKQLLNEFMDKSADFAQAHPEQTALWVARAAAAMELLQSKAGREAAQKLLAVPNPDDKTQKVLAMLERKGWTEAVVTPANIVIADLNLTMVDIQAGTFTMGSPTIEPERSDDEAQFHVTLTMPFWLGRTHVTQAQWPAIMDTTIQQQTKAGGDDLSGEGPDFPMYDVSWNEAIAFCQKLTQRERVAGRLPVGYQYTLPTEAQWEYACRAETTGPYEGDLDTMAWHAENSGQIAHKVGTKQANVWGLYDMIGNVQQWCLDWYGDYPGESIINPTGPPSGYLRVYRGSGSDYATGMAVLSRTARRGRDGPDRRHPQVGFRLALSPAP